MHLAQYLILYPTLVEQTVIYEGSFFARVRSAGENRGRRFKRREQNPQTLPRRNICREYVRWLAWLVRATSSTNHDRSRSAPEIRSRLTMAHYMQMRSGERKGKGERVRFSFSRADLFDCAF